jgi:hypothetical protein
MNSNLELYWAKSIRPVLKALIYLLSSLISLLRNLVMQFQTPYFNWTQLISTLHFLMNWNTVTFSGKDQGMFSIRIGDKYLTANSSQIYTDAPIYYLSHFACKRLEQATAAAIAPTSINLINVGLDKISLRVLAVDNHTIYICKQCGMQCREYPTNPDGYCTFHKRTGYITEQCRACLQPPTTDLQCYNYNKFKHKSLDYPERNYVPFSVPTLMLIPISTLSSKEPPIQPQAPPRIHMIQTLTSRISMYPSEEQLYIHIIQMLTLRISIYLFNASDSITSDA